MAKKCDFSSEVSNGAKALVVTAIIGAGASLLKRLGKHPRKGPGRAKSK